MSSGSVRMHVSVDIHQHEPPPSGDGRDAVPDAREELPGTAAECRFSGRLWRENGKLLYQGVDDAEPTSVRVMWARPLSGRDGPVSIMLAGKKREVAYLPCLEVLPEESRRVAREELAAGMVLPRITRIHRVWPRFGNYYWDVETDMGPRQFLLSAPENNSMRPMRDALVVKDVSGNCYEINPLSALDGDSLRELDRVL